MSAGELSERLIELTMAARHTGVDPSDAVDAARGVAADRDEPVDDTADALVEQLLAGVGLEAAVSALRNA